MKPALKAVLLSGLVSIAAAGLLLFGFHLGRQDVIRPIRQQVYAVVHFQTLGSLLNSRLKREAVNAYYDPKQAKREIGSYIWSVPDMPAPFVGTLPLPGKHFNAQINSLGFRAASEVRMPKPDGVYRIFLTGGSVAFGTGAPSQDRTIAAYLERQLSTELGPATGRTYEVWSAGNPAWVSTHERILIENRLSELEPDLVISFSGNNDVHWAERGRNTLWFQTYFEAHFYSVLRQSYATAGGVTFPEPEADSDPRPPDEVAAHLVKNVELAAWALERRQARYAFVLQPTLPVEPKVLTSREARLLEKRQAQMEGDAEYFRSCYQALDAALQGVDAPNLTYVSLTGVFAGQSRGTEIYIDAYHYGDRGNEIVASALLETLRDVILETEQ